MFSYLYKHWAFMCLPIAIFSTLILACSFSVLSLSIFLIWIQFPIYLVHQFEEHAYPGGFKRFINENIFKIKGVDMPLTDQSVFWINATAIWFFFPLFAALAQLVNPIFGVILPCFGLFNATTHILVAILLRKYNPGLLVSLFLNYPFGIYTLYVLTQMGNFGLEANLIGWGAALLGHILMMLDGALKARAYKQRRSRG